MQGVFLYGTRPKSKAEIKRFLDDPESDLFGLVIEATSVFGNEYDGSLFNAPKDKSFYIVGPDPQTKRVFYGTISWSINKNRWVIQ